MGRLVFALLCVRDRSGYETLNQLRIANYELRITSYELPVTNYQLRITEREELRDKTNPIYAARGTPQK